MIPDRGEDAPEEKAGTLRPIRPGEVYSALDLKNMIGDNPGLERALLKMAMLIGLRHGELNALRWQTVYLKAGTLYVNRSLPQLAGGAVLERPKTKGAFWPIEACVRAVVELRQWKLDAYYRRIALFSQLKKWRRELVNDLSGDDNISTQQSALIDLAVKSKLLLDSIDAWLLTQSTLIDKRKKALLPVILQRQILADGLTRYLAQLGLERRHDRAGARMGSTQSISRLTGSLAVAFELEQGYQLFGIPPC